MSALGFIQRLVREERGGSAVEFALVIPVILLSIFLSIDVGVYGWKINIGEKSSQMGARFAAVTDSVDSAMATYDFVGKTVSGVTYTQGDVIQASALGVETCTNTSCTCSPACPWTPSYNSTAFTNILARVQKTYPSVTAANLVVEYRGSGLGYAGDPNGMDIAPLVTVKLVNLTYSPMSLYLVRAAVALPPFSYSLTSEDASGSASF